MKYLLTFFIIFLFFSCGIEEFVEPEYLNPPFNLTAYPKNNKIKIQFYSNNKEEKFDGFNIYINTSSSLRTQEILTPVKSPLSGGIPTVNRTSKQINPDTPIEVLIERDANDDPIENGIRYYLIVKAHSIRNYKSEPSNETYTTPRVDNLNGEIIDINKGFNFNDLSKSAPYNFLFKTNNNNPYIAAVNYNSIQSLGYYANWEIVNTAKEYGYVDSSTPLRIKEGHVLLIKTADNRYGKIQIKEIKTTGGNPYIKIIWAFQQNINNKDI